MDAQSENPLVSVIMPAYNVEKYIEAAIRSVLSQTYTNWELLVLDDGSTDRTAEIAENFVKADPRVRLLQNPQNLGPARTRNRGFDTAAGDWAALLDSDDVWHRDKLEKQLVAAKCTGAEIIYCSYSLMDKNGRKISDFIVPERTSYSAMLEKNVLSCSTVLLSRSIFSEYRFSTKYYHEDYAFWLQLVRLGFAAFGCKDVLMDYRIQHGSRSSNKLRSAKRVWLVYRKAEKLSFAKSVQAFAGYARHGITKYKGVWNERHRVEE